MQKFLLSIAAVAAAMSANAENLNTFSDETLPTGVYYLEDFEWLSPWSAYKNADGLPVGDTVGDDYLDSYCPFIDTPKVDGVSAQAAMENTGMKFHFAQNGKAESAAGKSVYLQSNYLKFGKSGYQSGISLPALPDAAAGKDLGVEFDWCPMRQGDGTMDPTAIVVIVTNGDDVKTFAAPAHGMEKGSVLRWTTAQIKLEGVTVNNETRITIRPEDSQWSVSGQHRWFIDNIKVCDASQLAGIDNVAADETETTSPVEYYNLQGIRVAADNLPAGLYIRHQGSTATKVLVR